MLNKILSESESEATYQIWVDDRGKSIFDITLLGAFIVHSAMLLQKVTDSDQPYAVIKTHDLIEVSS